MISVNTSDICSILNLNWDKDNFGRLPRSLRVTPFDDEDKSGVFSFSKRKENILGAYSNSILILAANENSVIYDAAIGSIIVYSESPRDLFFTCLAKGVDFSAKGSSEYIEKSSGCFVHKSAQITQNCRIGKNTIIHPNCVIFDNVKIGNNCVIGPGSIIGYSGFGIVKDEAGNNLKIPHFGGVMISDGCNIGALNTIASGTLQATFIGRYTCTDDHVHIAHNVRIGENCIITACAELSGSVRIDDGVWIGPNSSIKNGIRVNSGALIGIGSNILKDIPSDSIVAGNPGKVR